MAIALRKAPLQRTARYVFDTLSPDRAHPITLIVQHAGESNSAYYNAQIKQINELRGRTGGSRAVGGDDATRIRNEYADRYSQYVVVGWEHVTEDGKPLACTPENVRRFFDQLIAPGPDSWYDAFDAFRAWCQDEDNFRAPIADAVDLGKG